MYLFELDYYATEQTRAISVATPIRLDVVPRLSKYAALSSVLISSLDIGSFIKRNRLTSMIAPE